MRLQLRTVIILVLGPMIVAVAALLWMISDRPEVTDLPDPGPGRIWTDSCDGPHPPEFHCWDSVRTTMSLDDVEKKANQGNLSMQLFLGDEYFFGRSKNRDFAEAMNWYRKAADPGRWENAAAAIYVARTYQEGGHGIEKDYGEAAKWYKKAADRGNSYPNAYLFLAHLYEEGGPGLPRDYAKAYFWYTVATLSPSREVWPDAYAREREAAAEHLTAAEKAAADKRAAEWKPPLGPFPKKDGGPP
jgi:hypothetical protein